jgi:hypothetical protein
MIEAGTTLDGRFLLDRELGRGGMGIVYKARDTVLDRPVAIKVLKNVGDPALARKIRLEAQITARLSHPHVVGLFDIREAEQTSYIVMEIVEGSSFQGKFKELALPARLRIAAETAEALEYAHRQGVIHRDVKPANILLDAEDRAKLSDFGLSIRSEDARAGGTIQGTPLYMSPEQAQGKKTDHRTDLYALGVILYECAAGVPPFAGPIAAVMSQHVGSEPEPLDRRAPGVDPELARLAHALMAKSPDRRPASGKAVADALRGILARSSGNEAQATSSPADPPAQQPAAAVAAPSKGTSAKGTSAAKATGETPPLARKLADLVEAGPLALTPEQRFLAGHYLAYLLGGSRREGIFGSRPLDARNADRARLLLALPSLMLRKGSDEAVAEAAELFEKRVEVRSVLSPAIAIKYLLARRGDARRKQFRELRERLLQASPYAQKHLVDSNGALNPGMPQDLDDLAIFAPKRFEVDDALVARWNRLAEVWRASPDYRRSVLRYATLNAWKDPAHIQLWPEVIDPLLERARWQRRRRTKIEAVWENIGGKILHIPDAAAGLQFDREYARAIPKDIVEDLDPDQEVFEEDIEEELEPADIPPSSSSSSSSEAARVPIDEADEYDAPAAQPRLAVSRKALDQIIGDTAEPGPDGLIPLERPEPYRFTLGELRGLYNDAAQRNAGGPAGQKHLRIGPYRIDVVPSYRGRSAGEVAIVGPGCRIDLNTPSIKLSKESSQRAVLAAWLYRDQSLAITHLDYKSSQQYAFYYAPTRSRAMFHDPGELNHALYERRMEVPERVREVLSKRYRPSGAE